MKKLLLVIFSVLAVTLMTGCASVPMASLEADAIAKQFNPPSEGKSGVYIYRDTFIGQALKKELKIDGTPIGKTANKVFFYKEVEPGSHQISTQSEFGDNHVFFEAKPGKHYFFEQYIKMGVFIGGANLKEVSEAKGKNAIQQCSLAEGY